MGRAQRTRLQDRRDLGRQHGRNLKIGGRLFKRHLLRGDAAAALAAVKKDPKLVRAELWRDLDSGATVLHYAAEAGDVGVCAALLDDCGGADLLRAVDLTGRTAVHYAAAKHRAGACAELLARMGNPLAPSAGGRVWW